MSFLYFRLAGTLDNSRCVISLQGGEKKKCPSLLLRAAGFDLCLPELQGFLQWKWKRLFPLQLPPKPRDLRQDLCVKSPPWSCWEMSRAMQLVGPSVELINPASPAITLGSQPKANMLLCPFRSLWASVWQEGNIPQHLTLSGLLLRALRCKPGQEGKSAFCFYLLYAIYFTFWKLYRFVILPASCTTRFSISFFKICHKLALIACLCVLGLFFFLRSVHSLMPISMMWVVSQGVFCTIFSRLWFVQNRPNELLYTNPLSPLEFLKRLCLPSTAADLKNLHLK